MTTIALQHKVKAITLPTVNFKAVYAFGFISLMLMVIFYAYAVNSLIGGSYVIKSYNKEIGKLETQNASLEGSVAAAGFMGNVQTQARYLGFEKTTQVRYIEITSTALAKAK